MQPSETWTLVGIDWGQSAALDPRRAAELFEHSEHSPALCPCPVPGVSLLAYRSASGAVDDAVRVLDAGIAKIAMLTCEYGKPDYIGFSPVSTRVFGLLRILPGGVAICALSTYEAVRHAAEDPAMFLDLGPVGLPDVGGRERVFQICRLGTDPSPITLDRGERTLDTLPNDHGYFVGRKVELDRALLHVEQGRSVTLTGIAGIGKSHLATRAAREIKDHFTSGVAWISLPGATTADQVTASFAAGLGLAAGTDVVASIRRIVVEEQVLVVLDGVDGCREIVRELIDGPFRGGSSRFIVSSPTPLGYAGEEVVPLAPLTVPPPDTIAEPDDLYDYEASALFLDRVAELSDSLLEHMDPDAVAELVRRLEGHPQRICLAAAQTRFQSVPMILKDLPPVGTRIRDTLAVSLGGLPRVAQEAAIALGLCETPVSLFQLGKLDPRFQLEPTAIDTLIKSGLCEESLSRSGRIVYSLFPSVKEHVRKIAAPTRKKLARRHEELFIGLVHEAVAGHSMTATAGDLELAEEHAPDVFSALTALAHRGTANDLYLAIFDAWAFLYDHNHINECLSLIEAKVSVGKQCEGIATAKLLNIGGTLANKAGRSRKAHSYFESALARLDVCDDVLIRAKIVSNLASLEWADGNPEGARTRYAFAADLYRYAGEKDGLASTLISSVTAHIECGDIDAAGAALETAIALVAAPTPSHHWCFAIGRSQVEWSRKNYAAARSHAAAAVQIALEMNDQLSVLRSLIWLAQSLVDANELAPSTQVLAVAAHNQTEQAYRLYRANEMRVERMRKRLVSGLGETRYRSEFIAGSTQSLDQVLASIC